MGAEPKEELGSSQEVKEKPSYVMRVVAARRRTGLDVELVPRQSRGVEVRADNVIVIDGDGDEVQVEVPGPQEGHMEQSAETLFSPTTKGPYVSQGCWFC